MNTRPTSLPAPDGGQAQTAGLATGSLISLEDMSVGYDRRQPVLSGVSLSIARGSFTALLGANGSGKSTLLKTLLGLLPPLAGRVRIEATADDPVVFGYVPQTLQFDPIYPLTGFDVALMGATARLSAGRRVRRTERDFTRECLRATGAEEFSRQRFAQLSGGQKQRVLIARALATRASVLVLDEPTAGVDAAATHALLEVLGGAPLCRAGLSQIHAQGSLTVLLATHDLPLVRRHARQIVWLRQGKVLHGTVAEVLTPERMAEFLEMEVG